MRRSGSDEHDRVDGADERRIAHRGAADRTSAGSGAVSDHWIEPIYAGADGSYYTDWETARKIERGEWRPCLREERSGKRLVETSANDLLMLVPTTREALPDWAQVRVDGSAARVVDTRRPVP